MFEGLHQRVEDLLEHKCFTRDACRKSGDVFMMIRVIALQLPDQRFSGPNVENSVQQNSRAKLKSIKQQC